MVSSNDCRFNAVLNFLENLMQSRPASDKYRPKPYDRTSLNACDREDAGIADPARDAEFRSRR